MRNQIIKEKEMECEDRVNERGGDRKRKLIKRKLISSERTQ